MRKNQFFLNIFQKYLFRRRIPYNNCLGKYYSIFQIITRSRNNFNYVTRIENKMSYDDH